MQHLASPWIFTQTVSNRASPTLFFIYHPLLSSFLRNMDIALDAWGKSSWLNHRLGYLQWNLTVVWQVHSMLLPFPTTRVLCSSLPTHSSCLPLCQLPLLDFSFIPYGLFPSHSIYHWIYLNLELFSLIKRFIIIAIFLYFFFLFFFF